MIKSSKLWLERMLMPNNIDAAGNYYFLELNGDETTAINAVTNIAPSLADAARRTALQTAGFKVVGFGVCQSRCRANFYQYTFNSSNAIVAGTVTHAICVLNSELFVAMDVGLETSDAMLRLPKVQYALNEAFPESVTRFSNDWGV